MATQTKGETRGQKVLCRLKKAVWITLFILAILLGVYIIGRPTLSLIELRKEITSLEATKANYEEIIRKETEVIENLGNDEYLEQYAREHYFMQGKDEHVFIVE